MVNYHWSTTIKRRNSGLHVVARSPKLLQHLGPNRLVVQAMLGMVTSRPHFEWHVPSKIDQGVVGLPRRLSHWKNSLSWNLHPNLLPAAFAAFGSYCGFLFNKDEFQSFQRLCQVSMYFSQVLRVFVQCAMRIPYHFMGPGDVPNWSRTWTQQLALIDQRTQQLELTQQWSMWFLHVQSSTRVFLCKHLSHRLLLPLFVRQPA